MWYYIVFDYIFQFKTIKKNVMILFIILLSTNILAFETSKTHVIGEENTLTLNEIDLDGVTKNSDLKLILQKGETTIKTWLKKDFTIKGDFYIISLEYPKNLKSGDYILILVTENSSEMKKIFIKRSFKSWLNSIGENWILPFIDKIKTFI